MMFRIAPAAPPSAYKTYKVGAPPSHYRPATCAEVDCDDYVNGWTMIVGLDDAKVLHAVRASGRPFRETVGPVSITFDFEPGYACRTPSAHRVLERPEIYVVRGGDWRGNPSGFRRVHTSPDHWVEDFGEHQSKLVEIARRG
jgi:hypothetical protein